MDNQARITYIQNQFRARFGGDPTIWAGAPGRVDLMGSHTDYNQGYVMTMTVDRDTWIAARPRPDGKVRIYSLNKDGGGEFALDRIEPDLSIPWTNYVRGMAEVMWASGLALVGFDGLIHSTIPFGSGLSSSAALEMATAMVFLHAGNLSMDKVDVALLGQKAENSFVGVNSGILDQYSSMMGQAGCALVLDCRSLTSYTVQAPADMQVVICDTHAVRSLVGSEYDQRRRQCEEGVRLLQQHLRKITALRDVSLPEFNRFEAVLPVPIGRRCRFIIEENQRVLELAEALPVGDRKRLFDIMNRSWIGARDLYEISVPAMEAMIAATRQAPGIIGARQAGAGFGGCMIALVEFGQVDAFSSFVSQMYYEMTNTRPDIYPVKAVAGAGLLE